MVCADTQNGNINVWLTPYQPGIKSAPIGQGDFDTPCLPDDVGISKDLAVRGKDEARAKATTKVWASAVGSTKAPAFAFYVNSDHCWSDSLRRCGYCMRVGI